MEGLDQLKISEERKKYIVDQLNPVLEEMVAECIHRLPKNPVPFMQEWLEQKKVTEEDSRLSADEKQKIAAENRKLQEDVAKLKAQMQEAAKLAADNQKEEESEEEEDDADDEPPPDFERPMQNRARQSVSAEAYGEWNTKKAFVPPVIVKTEEQKDRLKRCLCRSFLFSSLEENDIGIVIGAMKEVIAEPKQRVIMQGDNGDFLFVIESGKLDCIIKKEDGSEIVVKTCEVGDVFGELALLYNCPRAASVEARDKCTLWQLDRDTFNAIVKEAAQKKRQRYDNFLQKVPLLATMNPYERSQIADALKVENVADAQTIVSQGEAGTKFYIIEEGECVASKNGVQVMSFASGDYFGELALIRNQPRAATVMSKGPVRLLSLDSGSFKRLLNVQELLDKSTRYS